MPIICKSESLPQKGMRVDLTDRERSTGHAGVAGVLHALYLRRNLGGSYAVQCSLLVSNLHMLKRGTYDPDQLEALKKRNPDYVGKVRHFDEIVSLSVKGGIINGFKADRAQEIAFKQKYYQQIDGSPFGLGPLEVVNLALRMSQTRTDFSLGAAPPGYHLPSWSVKKNPDFEPIQPVSDGN